MTIAVSKIHLDQMETWLEWKKLNNPKAKQQLIEHYFPLVQLVSRKTANGLPSSVSEEDLQSYGVIGLIDAIEKFDIERGVQFRTYAMWRIKGAIIDSLRQADWVPRSVRERAKKIEEAYQHLEQKHLRSATEDEVCQHLGIDKEELHKTFEEVSAASLSSLEEPIHEDDSETLMSKIKDESLKHPEDTVRQTFLKETLAQAIETLTERERTVVSLYYYEQLTFSEIAAVMSLTLSRISQLHSKALWRLRNGLERQKKVLQER